MAKESVKRAVRDVPVDNPLRRSMEHALREAGRPNWMVESRICAAVAYEHFGIDVEPGVSAEKWIAEHIG